MTVADLKRILAVTPDNFLVVGETRPVGAEGIVTDNIRVRTLADLETISITLTPIPKPQ